MPALSLRLPEELDHRLAQEAEHEGIPRSEVARQAIVDYLARRERERFMAELVSEAREGYANEAIRSEALDLAEDAVFISNEAFDRAQRMDNATLPEENDRWWK